MNQTTPRLYTLQIEITEETRVRLDLVKTIIRLERRGMINPTWADAVMWLADVVPVPQLLADLCRPADNEGTKGE